MALEDIDIRVLTNRNRVQLRIRDERAEMTAEEVGTLLAALTAAARDMSMSVGRADAAPPCARLRPLRMRVLDLILLHHRGRKPVPSTFRMAAMLEAHPRTVRKVLHRLEDEGRIKVIRRAGNPSLIRVTEGTEL